MQKVKVLFLCTGNSARSQMAEGLANFLFGDKIKVFSAGIEARGLNPFAVEAMAEIGVDISSQESKTIEDLKGTSFDLVITLCGNARSTCPVFPGTATKIHKEFDDPAAQGGPEEEKIKAFRKSRKEIEKFIKKLPATIEELNIDECN